MELKEKVERALRNQFQVDYLDLVDNEGITGVMVSPDFEGVGRLDRHRRIDRALRDRSGKLTRREQDRVVLIAPFTPTEYGPIGPDGDEDDTDDTHADDGASDCLAGLVLKVEHILRSRFRVYVLRLDRGNGIYGFVVSPDFEDLSSSERQDLFRQAFRDPSSNLTDCERRRITFISTLTPAEYEAKLALDD
jgi:acid stress-induced BolA-like protein IbaG/YrbA